jgi:gamma-glutamyltranspeptidase/glutathione hydrolase
VDAAIAVNAVLGVVYPHMTGIGGDAIWLIYDATSQQVHALNGSGRAAAGATRSFFRDQGHKAMPTVGPQSIVTVPGAVDSWLAAHKRFGHLPMGTLLAAAIDYSRDGAPAAAGFARATKEHAEKLRQFPITARQFLPQGNALEHGDVMMAENLAKTLEAIAAEGRSGFYAGSVAAGICAGVEAGGGVLTVADFEAHESTWSAPIITTYRGLTCYQHPPNSQGLVHLITLNILEGFDLGAMGENSPEHLHLCVEAAKLAYTVRDRYLTDPAFTEIPLDHLLSKEYATELRSRISLTETMTSLVAPDASGDTTCTVVVDADGNAVSVIQSICHVFGSGYIAGDTGVLLHNRGSKFSLLARNVNSLEPGKRTAHTLMPGMIMHNTVPWLVYGTMGGDGQPQTNTALVVRTVDFDHDIQSAIDSPRALYGQFWGERTNDLWLEGRFEGSTVDGLHRLGHPAHSVEDWSEIMGHAQGIMIDRDRGILMGGSDPRGDGVAIGW